MVLNSSLSWPSPKGLAHIERNLRFLLHWQNGDMQQFRSITMGNHNPFPERIHGIGIKALSNCCSNAIWCSNSKYFPLTSWGCQISHAKMHQCSQLGQQERNQRWLPYEDGTNESDHSPQQVRSLLVAHMKRTTKGWTPFCSIYYIIVAPK